MGNELSIKTIKQKFPRVVAISSGKGGVGKSSITVNLGISLAKRGFKVCVFDADTGLANANILLGLTPKFSLEHVLYGAKPIEEIMLDGPFGLKVIPGANGISECVSLRFRQQLYLTKELSRIENDFDFIIIDTAAGISRTTLDFISASQHSLVVITPEPTSLTDAFSLVKLLKRRSSKVYYHVVVNMCSGAKQAQNVYNRFCSAISKYIGVEIHYLGFVLRDESMQTAVTLQNPVAMFSDNDPSSRCFLRLADTLDSTTQVVGSQRSFSGYWQQQFKLKRQNNEKNSEKESVSAKSRSIENSMLDSNSESSFLEIGSRILRLVEQKSVDIDILKKVLQDIVDVFVKCNNSIPIDVLRLVDFLAQSPERNDLLLRDIFDRVQHWGANTHYNVDDKLPDGCNIFGLDGEGNQREDVLLPTPLHIFPCVPETDVDISDMKTSGSLLSMLENLQDVSGLKKVEPNIQSYVNLKRKQNIQLSSFPSASISTFAFSKPIDSDGYLQRDHYDIDRFGPQERLLDIIKSRDNSEQPLSKMLETCFE